MSKPVTDTAASSSSAALAACTAAILSPSAARTSSRLSTASLHPFFRWLRDAPASAPDAQYFRRHFLPSATMCSCTVFPAYHTKIYLQLPSNPSARRFLHCLSYRCLACIYDALDNDELAPCKQYWTRALQREADFYLAASCMERCGSTRSASNILWGSITHPQHRESARQLHRSLVPTMGQLGWQLLDDDLSCIGLSWSRRPSSVQAS